jgi:type IV pilus assembly protein PilC
MPIFFSPGQLSQRAEFYRQLGQYASAGIGVVQALDQLQRQPPAASYRKPVQRVLSRLAQGLPLTDSLAGEPRWLPHFDLALIQAGEMSGRLDACFRLLAEHYSDRARLMRQMVSDLMYPAFVLHLAVFLFPFPDFFASGNLTPYLLKTLGLLFPLYGLIAALVYAAQGRHGESWRAAVERVLAPVPVLGTGRRFLALARLAAALEALLSAGVTIIEAWELAAAASGSPALRRAVAGWKPLFDSGGTPAEAIRGSGDFPGFFANHYHTGEVSGQLDQSLRQLHRFYQEEGVRKLHAVAQWTPRVVYLAVALTVAYRVVGFYMGYFKQIGEAGGF